MQPISRIAIVGTGNIATQLAKAFSEKSLQITQVCGRNAAKAKELAATVGAEAITGLNALEPADLILIAVKDDAIAEVAAQINSGNSLVAHTSGSVGMNILNRHTEYGVFYPLQTISKNREIDFTDIPVCIEAGSEKSSQKLSQLASTIAANPIKINSEEREKLHLAAVLINNFTNHLFAEAETFAQKHNLPFEILQPLARETVEKAFALGPQQAQTGPAKRNDEKTIDRHLQLLKGNEGPEKLYRLFTELIKRGSSL